MNLPKMHARELVTAKAEQEFNEFYIKWQRKHDLTFGEMLSIFSGKLAGFAKWMVRGERHPDDPDKPGGWA